MNERYLQIHCSSRSQDGVWVCVFTRLIPVWRERCLMIWRSQTRQTAVSETTAWWRSEPLNAADCPATRPTWQAETTSWHFISSLKKGQYRTLSCTKIVMIMFYDHFPPLPDTEWPLLWLANQAMRIRFVHKENKNNKFIKQFASSSYVARVMRRRWIVE